MSFSKNIKNYLREKNLGGLFTQKFVSGSGPSEKTGSGSLFCQVEQLKDLILP